MSRWLGALAAPLTLLTLGAVAVTAPSAPAPPDPEGLELFETKVRPVLAESCYGCHGAQQQMAGLRLDLPERMRKGGPRGPAVVPGDPEKSLMVQAIRYKDHALMMPPSGRLPLEKIAAVEAWIKRGAPMPAAAPKPAAPVGKAPSAAEVLAARRKHWAYQPVRRPATPAVKNAAWVRSPIDAFVLARLEKDGLKPAAPADRRTLIRRVTFDLTGLPPTPEDVEAFVADTSADAYNKVVGRLLASPAYGERWGRHWLDLMRYAETLGHEFDFEIANAWKYRDWAIRAFNDDVPYDQFIREHLAGDLLPNPRRDPKSGWNLSRQATGFFWLGEGKHSPVDVRQEQADRLDNQIDVIGKAFLGQTLACARCHDHKFDPIPQKDYYALYGILKSSRYEQAVVNDTAFPPVAARADALRRGIDRSAVAAAWRTSLAKVSDVELRRFAGEATLPGGGLTDLNRWLPSGEALKAPGEPGDLILTSDPKRPVAAILTRPTVHGGLRATRLPGALRSPSFTLNKRFLHVRVAGRQSRVNLVLENFVLIRGPLFDSCEQLLDHDDMRWHTIDLSLWPDRRGFVEVIDNPAPCLGAGNPPEKPVDGWAALDGVVLSDRATPPADSPNPLAAGGGDAARAALLAALARWESAAPLSAATDGPALALWNRLLQVAFLDTVPLEAVARERAALEASVPAPAFTLAMCDGPGEDERVFVRGNHRALGADAPRLKLALCFRENQPAPAEAGSGRLELARWLSSPTHPLTARVMVNRIWKHHFGNGIVRSPDDFGHMGEKPTHPELLDWLASEFVKNGWSVKKMHRLIVTSSVYRQDSAALDPVAERKDPRNERLHRMPVRRLEVEAIRDAMLAAAGSLKAETGGPSTLAYMADHTDGRGKPAQGPLDGDNRRSVYLGVRRNFPSPFFQAFDFPTPFTTIGRRSVSNVPAQALALMNGPLVREMARRWAEKIVALPAEQRVERLYRTAFGRPPTADERKSAEAFVADDPAAWPDLCHVLFNVKEFVFIR